MSVTRVSASSSNQTLLASNTARRSASVFNDTPAVLNLICSGTNSSATALTVKVDAGGLFVPPYQYVGTIKGIWPASGSSATELYRLPTGIFVISYEASSRAMYRQISTTTPIYGSGYTTGRRLGDGSVYALGMVFAMTFQGSDATIFKWADPTNPATVTSALVDLASNSTNYAGLVYDSTTGLLYAAGTYSFSPGLVDIYTINPTTLAVTLFVNAQTLNGTIGSNSPLTSDGTYLYFMEESTDVNCTIYKFALSDGSLVTSHQLGNQPGGAATTNGNAIVYDSSFLYCGGGLISNAWVAKVPVSLASDTVASVALNTNCDDIAIVGTDIWMASEDPALNGKIAQVSMSALSPTYYTLGTANGIGGIHYGSDGYLWVGRLTTWRVEQVDPATGSIVNTYTNAAQVTEN